MGVGLEYWSPEAPSKAIFTTDDDDVAILYPRNVTDFQNQLKFCLAYPWPGYNLEQRAGCVFGLSAAAGEGYFKDILTAGVTAELDPVSPAHVDPDPLVPRLKDDEAENFPVCSHPSIRAEWELWVACIIGHK